MNPLTQKATQQSGQNDIQQAFQQFQQSPKEYLEKAGLKIPEEYCKSYQSMVEYLVRTGRVPQHILSQISNMKRY